MYSYILQNLIYVVPCMQTFVSQFLGEETGKNMFLPVFANIFVKKTGFYW